MPYRYHKPGHGHLRDDGYLERQVDGIQKLEHVRIAEQVLGHALPKGAEVHHVNEVRSDNRNENLVICPTKGYHKLLHVRLRALNVSGHADWLKCCRCHQYDDVAKLYVSPDGVTAHHRACVNAYFRDRTKAKNIQTSQERK